MTYENKISNGKVAVFIAFILMAIGGFIVLSESEDTDAYTSVLDGATVTIGEEYRYRELSSQNITKMKFTSISGATVYTSSSYSTSVSINTEYTSGTFSGTYAYVYFVPTSQTVEISYQYTKEGDWWDWSNSNDISFTGQTASTTITINYNSNATITVNGTNYTGSTGSNTTITVSQSSLVRWSVTPDSGYSFTSLTVSDSTAGTSTTSQTSTGTFYATSTQYAITANVSHVSYEITIVAGSGGSVSANTISNVPYGASITYHGSRLIINGTTVTATPSTGYSFSSWSNASGTVTSDRTITANFSINTYTVSFSAGTGGSVSSNSISNVPYGSSISVSSNKVTINGTTITASASTGYSFGSWSNASGTVTSDRTITANFSINTYTVSFSAGTGGSVSSNSISNVPYGSSISVSSNQVAINGTTITATPNSHYIFSSWSNASGTVTSNRTITANFERDTVDVIVDAPYTPSNAVITVSAPGYATQTVTNNQTITYTVDANTTVTLSASTVEGYVFASWDFPDTDDSEEANPLTITATQDVSIDARYDQAYTVSFVAGTGGTVSANSISNVPHGSLISVNDNKVTINGTTITATPNAQYTFSSWSNASGRVMSDMTITANFGQNTVDVIVDAPYTPSNAVITVSAPGYATQTVTNNATITYTVVENTAVTLSASTVEGFVFASWDFPDTDDSEEANPLTITATQDVSIDARYDQARTVTFVAGTGGSVSANSLIVPHGSLITVNNNQVTINGTTVTATPDTHYSFSSWTNASGRVMSDMTITANFTIHTWDITFLDMEAGTISVDGTPIDFNNQPSVTIAYPVNSIIELEYTQIDVDYSFVKWVLTDMDIPELVDDITDNPYTMTVNANYRIEVVVGVSTYTITFDAATNGGTLVGDPTKIVTVGQTYGTMPTATKDDYNFIGWFTQPSGGTQKTSDSTVAITQNQTLYAQFVERPVSEVWWDNSYVNGSVSIAFDFVTTSSNLTHSMHIPLVEFDGIEDNGDGIKYFSDSGYYLDIIVPYNGNLVCTLTSPSNVSISDSFRTGTWLQFTLNVDAQSGKVIFNGTRSLGWNVNQSYTFTNYETVYSKTIFDFSPSVSNLAISKIYHEDIGSGTNHPRFQVTSTTTYLDTYGYVMVNPELNIYQQFPNYDDLRLNLYSFAIYGDSLTINGHQFNMSGSKISVYYTDVEDANGDIHHVVASQSTANAIHIEPTLSNVFITWENIASNESDERQCYLTFVDDNLTIELGTFAQYDLTISGQGVWYFTTALYEPYQSTETHYEMDWNNWFNLSSDGFLLVMIGITILATVVANVIWKPSIIDYAIIIGSGIIAYILLGGL